MLIETLTDNRNRTNGEVRSILDKNGGSIGASGSVAYMFSRLGQIEIPASATSEEQLYDVALEAGADDITLLDDGTDDARFLIATSVSALDDVKKAVEAAGLEPTRCEYAMVPGTTVEADLEVAKKVMRIQGLLEENDDVQTVTTQPRCVRGGRSGACCRGVGRKMIVNDAARAAFAARDRGPLRSFDVDAQPGR